MSKFDDLLNAARAVAALRPLIGAIIDEVEAAFPNIPGKDKLNHALAAIAAAWDQIEALKGIFDTALPIIRAVIAAIVSIRNASGAFSKGTP